MILPELWTDLRRLSCGSGVWPQLHSSWSRWREVPRNEGS